MAAKISYTKVTTYTEQLELDQFGIKNDGTSPKETSAGLNKALQYAKEQGFENVIFPPGTYLIDETNPIVIDLKNTVIDLNGSTLQINTNGLDKYAIIEFRDGAEDVRLTNGTVRGDKDTHDYLTVKSTHEGGCGVVFKSGKNLQMDNVTVINVPGYGIMSESGNSANRFHTLYTKEVTLGSISDEGIMIPSTATSRTIKPYDISVCGGQFELGYTLGYQGYPYLFNRNYTSCFYDKDMNFIQKKECIQFRKVDIPTGAVYVHFVFPQVRIVSNLGYYAWITNLRPSTNVTLTACLIKGNRSLGLAFSGGQQWVIENNIFDGNGGNAPNYAVDFEDGWELMQDVVFRNNKFVNNNNDLVVCAGDNLVFEGNEFQKMVYFWSRTTNYKFQGNKCNGGSVTFQTKNDPCEVSGNQYYDTKVRTSSSLITLNNESLLNCIIEVAAGTKFINSTVKITDKRMMSNAAFEYCNLEIAAAEAINLIFKNCRITNSTANLQFGHYFDNCEISNSRFFTYTTSTQIHFKDCEFINGQMNYNTWGAAAETIFEGCRATMNSNLSLVRLSAGKTRKLLFSNNNVVNETAKPVFELFDTTYTIPDGNAIIEGNSFTLRNRGYAFDGVNINKGNFTLSDRGNVVTGGEMLNPKYIGNPFFAINL